MLNNLHTSVNIKTIELLNKQVTMECESSLIYLNMASWCHVRGYTHSSDFFYRQSEEEKDHMTRLVKYINDVGGHLRINNLSNLTPQIDSFKSLFEISLQHEQEVTKSIHYIADHCLTTKDFSTFGFIQWYIEEQKEEEFTVNRILELFSIIGQEMTRQYEIDIEIGKINKDKNAKQN